jgi:hypothetical protein
VQFSETARLLLSTRSKSEQTLGLTQSVEQFLAFHAFMDTYGTHDAIQRADAERIVIGHGETLMRWRVSLQDNMAAFLMHDAVAPVAA